MKKMLSLMFLSLTTPVYAGMNANVSILTNYILHGITQTNQDPAVQGEFDYLFDNGLYVGTWASNVSFLGTPNSLEDDIYAGYKFKFADTMSADLGFMQIFYPGAPINADFNTIYGSLTYGFLTVKEGYSPDVLNTDTYRLYSEINATYPIKFHYYYLQNISLLAHLAYTNFGNVIKAGLDNYWDWSIGFSKTFAKNYSISLVYTDNSLSNNFYPYYKSAFVGAISCKIE